MRPTSPTIVVASASAVWVADSVTAPEAETVVPTTACTVLWTVACRSARTPLRPDAAAADRRGGALRGGGDDVDVAAGDGDDGAGVAVARADERLDVGVDERRGVATRAGGERDGDGEEGRLGRVDGGCRDAQAAGGQDGIGPDPRPGADRVGAGVGAIVAVAKKAAMAMAPPAPPRASAVAVAVPSALTAAAATTVTRAPEPMKASRLPRTPRSSCCRRRRRRDGADRRLGGRRADRRPAADAADGDGQRAGLNGRPLPMKARVEPSANARTVRAPMPRPPTVTPVVSATAVWLISARIDSARHHDLAGVAGGLAPNAGPRRASVNPDDCAWASAPVPPRRPTASVKMSIRTVVSARARTSSDAR